VVYLIVKNLNSLICFRVIVLPKGFKNGSRDKSKEFEAVFLNSLDGFGFEAFCERLFFEKSGWGRIERIGMVGDAGRDLIIHTSQGKIVVECKHQPNSTIVNLIDRKTINKIRCRELHELYFL